MVDTYVVTTPAGNIGRHVVGRLVTAEKSIRVITRHPDRLNADIQSAAEVIQGSIDDSELLSQALDGAAAMFWCVPQSHTQENVLDYYLQFARAAAIAIRTTQMPRIVSISSGGKGLAQNAGAISALHAMEDILNETGISARHLRCGNFIENFLWQTAAIAHQSKFFYPLPGDYPIPMVTTADIGKVAAQWLSDRTWSGQEGIAVQGAEDLSLNQSAEILSRVLDKPIQFQQVPPAAYYESMLKHGASPAFAQSLVDLFAEVANGIYHAEPRTSATTTDTTLEQWAKQVLPTAFSQNSRSPFTV
jgi:uncharacterized protein YbjT (DUF2867 family)